jgi:putative ABC transport system substrate-binding protein
VSFRARRLVASLLGLLLVPIAAPAQTPTRMPMVGILSPVPGTSAINQAYQDAFEGGLRERGWQPGQNVRLEYRYAEGAPERLDELARELVRVGVDAIVARSSLAIGAAKRATTTIPIVMSATGQDPIQSGFVASLARPGGNVTGLSLLIQELRPKQLQLLRELVPQVSRVTVLGGTVALTAPERERLETTAAGLDLRLRYVTVKRATDLDKVFADMAGAGVGALLVLADPAVLEPNTHRIVTLALRHRLPAVYWLRSYPQAGGLMSYGADLIDVHRRSAFYVDRVLRGARPADLPVEQPSKLALVVNLKTATAIGLALPPSILARADEVIQ